MNTRRRSDWRCSSCGRTQDGEQRRSFCGDCFNGRNQSIEDTLADKLGLPRRVLTKSRRAF